MQRVTIREDFDSGDMVVLENGVSIPAQFGQDSGVIADFGTLTFQKQLPPCRLKKIRDISASRLPRVGDGVLVWPMTPEGPHHYTRSSDS